MSSKGESTSQPLTHNNIEKKNSLNMNEDIFVAQGWGFWKCLCLLTLKGTVDQVFGTSIVGDQTGHR